MEQHTKHDQPFRLLHTVRVRLGIPQRLPVDFVGLLDLIWGTVTDKDGLATPFDDHLSGKTLSDLIQRGFQYNNGRPGTYVLALWDRRKSDFDLGLGQDICRGGHVDEEVCRHDINQHPERSLFHHNSKDPIASHLLPDMAEILCQWKNTNTNITYPAR